MRRARDGAGAGGGGSLLSLPPSPFPHFLFFLFCYFIFIFCDAFCQEHLIVNIVNNLSLPSGYHPIDGVSFFFFFFFFFFLPSSLLWLLILLCMGLVLQVSLARYRPTSIDSPTGAR